MEERLREVVRVGEARLDVARWGSGGPAIVLLHDGLGSIEQFGDFPGRLASAVSAEVVAFDRAGHGKSLPPPDGPWPADWLEREADVLGGLLDALELTRAVLVGHSDGGSIALLHAAGADADLAALVAVAAHSYVEPVCVAAIEQMRARRDRLVPSLGRFHAHPHEVFEAWSGVWTSPEFRDWDARPRLGVIAVPTLVVQGTDDEYATPRMLEETVAAIGANAEPLPVPGGGHLLPQERSAETAAAIAAFLGRVGAATA